MKMEVSYATMSFLRMLVKKVQLEHWKNLPKSSEFDKLPVEEIQKRYDKYWQFHDMTPQISDQSCMVAILKECERLEDECQEALKLNIQIREE